MNSKVDRGFIHCRMTALARSFYHSPLSTCLFIMKIQPSDIMPMNQEPAAGSESIELAHKIKSKRTISCPFENAALRKYQFYRPL